MSLMKTLGKVAMGVIMAKGVGKVLNGGNSSNAGGGLGGMLGGLMGGNNSQGGLGSLLGQLTGGGNAQSGGGLGGLLGSVLGGGQQGGSGGGIGDLIAGLSGQGAAASTGGLGGLLSQLGGATAPAQGGQRDFGKMFNDALAGKEPEQVSQQDEKNAEILLRAMISATKADGELSDDEQAKITEHLGDVSAEEAEFVRNELAAPMDINGLVASVPAGLEQQVYLMSLMAITLDTKEEAVYLDSLRQGLKLSEQVCNDIHTKLGAPTLYN